MAYQPDLFRPMCGQHSARQDTLFDLQGSRESELSCTVCGAALVETPSGYLVCQNGHGKLLPTVEPSGSWFEAD